MKRFVCLLIVFLFLISLASAQGIKEFKTNIDIFEDGKAKIELNFIFTENVIQIDLPFPGYISEIETTEGECFIVKEIQQILRCKPTYQFFPKDENITINFFVNGLVTQQNSVNLFSLDLPILWRAENVNILLKLPPGAAVSDDIIIPVSPSEKEIGSDGRRIFLKWEFKNKNPDDIIPLRIYYEPINPPITNRFQLGWIISLLIVLIIIGSLIYWQIGKKRSELVLSVLNEAERIIVEIIRNQAEEKVDQRKIVDLSGFSKAKVSRIIRSLEERGIVESERIGRRNKIKLKKKFIKE